MLLLNRDESGQQPPLRVKCSRSVGNHQYEAVMMTEACRTGIKVGIPCSSYAKGPFLNHTLEINAQSLRALPPPLLSLQH